MPHFITDTEQSIVQYNRDQAKNLTSTARDVLQEVFQDNDSKKVVIGHIMSVLRPKIYGVKNFDSLREIIKLRIKNRSGVLQLGSTGQHLLAMEAGNEKILLMLTRYDSESITLKFKKLTKANKDGLKEVGSIVFKKEKLTLGIDEKTEELVANGTCEAKVNFEYKDEILDRLGIQVDTDEGKGYFELL